MNDSQIIALYWERNEDAIRETDQVYGPRLFAISDRLLHSRQDAQESVNDTYLKTSGEQSGIKSYSEVCDLLVNWHIQEVVLPSIAVEETPFDPFDETQVDLTGIANARTQEETQPNG